MIYSVCKKLSCYDIIFSDSTFKVIAKILMVVSRSITIRSMAGVERPDTQGLLIGNTSRLVQK